MSTSNLKLNGLEPDNEEEYEEEYEESFVHTKKSFRENKGVSMNEMQKNLVEEMVKADFETGMSKNDYDEVKALMEEDEDLAPVVDEATDYYFELLEMGPAGFYEEFPEMDWDEDFVNQYDDDNYSEDTDDRVYDDDYAFKYVSPEKQKLYDLFKGPCDNCDTVVTFEIPSMSYGNIWFNGEINEQEDRCIQRIVDNLKNAGYIIDRVIDKGDHCTIVWSQEMKEFTQKKAKSLKEDLNWQTDADDAMESLMILEDKENTDDYCFLDKDVGNIYKIFDRSENVAKLYDADNDCIIDEIPFDELDEEDRLRIEMAKNPPDLDFLD